MVFWVDGKTQSIKRASSNGTVGSVLVAGSETIHPFDLAFEPFSGLLFWTCSVNNSVNVTRLNGSSVGVVVRVENEKPRHIAIHSRRG
jgi:low density lipoprotein receptor-related protein 5/6